MKQYDRGQKMKKKIVIFLIMILVIVLSYFYAHIDKNSYLYDRNVDTKEFYSTGIISDKEGLIQTFVADEDAIDGVYIKISFVGEVGDVILHYTLTDDETEEAISASIKASDLDDNKFNHLKLPRIEGTKGKTYTLTLSTENVDEQNGIAFYVAPGKQTEQNLVVKGNEVDGTIVARMLCQRFDVETFVVLLGIVVFVTGFMKVLYKFFK